MRVYLDCIPCFFRQALEGARIVRVSPKRQKKIIDEFAVKIPGIPFSSSPPEIARVGYAILKKISSVSDPYKEIKRRSNRMALGLLPKLENKVVRSQDRLLTAVELAIAGNIIDFGVKNNLNVKEELKNILEREDENVRRKSIFHYREFKRALKGAGEVLYLADNSGEVVFDRILIEEIKRMYPDTNIHYAVKSTPVINDALPEDAKTCGIDKAACIIPNGTDAPGTVLSLCSKEFRDLYRRADMVIGKGQGNFESLSCEKRPIFFLFIVKCPVVANESGCKIGDIVLLYNLKKKR
ncbi:MAG: ARMT1-like domain-containing protein [Candidatus Omnitrophica bacterium]|nr:ARMT1-like domain-containing protein [Candidatus Omnitrophota bacterium]